MDLICPYQSLSQFSRIISIHYHSLQASYSPITLIPHSFSLPPTSENLEVIGGNSLQLPPTSFTNLKQEEVASWREPPSPTYIFWIHQLLPSQKAWISSFFVPIFSSLFPLGPLHWLPSVIMFSLYSLNFPIYKQNHYYPYLGTSSSSPPLSFLKVISLPLSHIFSPTNLASAFTTTETSLVTGLSADYVTKYREHLSNLVVLATDHCLLKFSSLGLCGFHERFSWLRPGPTFSPSQQAKSFLLLTHQQYTNESQIFTEARLLNSSLICPIGCSVSTSKLMCSKWNSSFF